VASDLRGYGDADKPPAGEENIGYSKRTLAKDQLAAWRERCNDARGRPLDCGHFLPEEAPEETLQ